MIMVIFFIFVLKNVYRLRFLDIKIRPSEGFELGPFFSHFFVRILVSENVLFLTLGLGPKRISKTTFEYKHTPN